MVIMSKLSLPLILVIVILLLSGALWFLYTKNQTLKTALESETQNMAALTDSLRVTVNKNGDLEYSKNVLMTDKEKLKKLNSQLHGAIEELGGKINQLTFTIIKLEMQLDTVYHNDLVVHPDSTYGIKWEFNRDHGNNNVRILHGITNFKVNQNPFQITPLNTQITRDYLTLSIYQGLRTRNGIIEGFSTSKFPGLSIEKQETAIITEKTSFFQSLKKNTKLGTYLGYGLTYNWSDNRIYNGAQAGVGLNFTFW